MTDFNNILAQLGVTPILPGSGGPTVPANTPTGNASLMERLGATLNNPLTAASAQLLAASGPQAGPGTGTGQAIGQALQAAQQQQAFNSRQALQSRLIERENKRQQAQQDIQLASSFTPESIEAYKAGQGPLVPIQAGGAAKIHKVERLGNGNFGVFMSNSAEPVDTGVPFAQAAKIVTNPDGSIDAVDPLNPGQRRTLLSSEDALDQLAERQRTEVLSTASAKNEADRPRKIQAITSSILATQDNLRAIDDALAGIDTAGGGFFASITSGIPGFESFSQQKQLDTVLARLGFTELQTMRDASKTGSALGQVTERELGFLQAAFEAIHIGMTPEEQRTALINIRDRQVRIGRLKQNEYAFERAKQRGLSDEEAYAEVPHPDLLPDNIVSSVDFSAPPEGRTSDGRTRLTFDEAMQRAGGQN